jgi:hypothetical protein
MNLEFLPFAWQFGMRFVIFAYACSTTNSKPENFVEMVLCFSLHAACEQLGTTFWVNDVFQPTFAWPTFSLKFG